MPIRKTRKKTVDLAKPANDGDVNINLHRAQSEVYRHLFDEDGSDDLRHLLVVASRGFGKSYLAAAVSVSAAFELEKLSPYVLNKNIAIIAASHDQTQTIYQPLLSNEFRLDEVAVKTKKPLKYRFPNGTEITCHSADASDKMRGSGQYLVIADEMATWKTPSSSIKDAWESVIEPCVTTRWSPENSQRVGAPSSGRTLIITTVKGKDYIFDLSHRHESDPRWTFFKYTYQDSPFISQEEIERVKANMDPILFAREYECDFGESGLAVFSVF